MVVGLQGIRVAVTHLNVGNFSANNEGGPLYPYPLVRNAASTYIEV
jgi:hypothetical protein